MEWMLENVLALILPLGLELVQVAETQRVVQLRPEAGTVTSGAEGQVSRLLILFIYFFHDC